MFCPKCGTKNPENGKFCRSCGTDLGNVSEALTGRPAKALAAVDHKGRPISWERATMKFFSGIAFLAVSIALAFSVVGQHWWYWMLIPAFMSIGAGVAQFVQLKKSEKAQGGLSSTVRVESIGSGNDAALPSAREEFVSPGSNYKTGDLVPPSVTDNTTRHLDLDSEKKTMTLSDD